jgi:hypothetical protein
MKIKNRLPIIYFVAILFLLAFSSLLVVDYNTLRGVKRFFLGDTALKSVLSQFHAQFIPQKLINYPRTNTDTSFGITWAFRPSHALPTNPIPVVTDADKDGNPEIYIGSYTKEVTVLDGKERKILWQWHLPFGVIGARVLALTDLDGDDKEELLIGSHTSLPIRLYAIKTEPKLKEKERLLWKLNTSGDFLEGGLNIYADTLNKQKYIVTASRDATYSRGSLQVCNTKGKLYYDNITGIDNCVSRPPLGKIISNDTPIIVNGSHNYYHPIWGNKFTARNLFTGKLVWKTPSLGDGGYLQHVIADLNFDGKKEVLIYFIDSLRKTQHWILNGVNGKKITEVDWELQGIDMENKTLLVSRKDSSFVLDMHGQVKFKMQKIDFSFKHGKTGKRVFFRVNNKDSFLKLIAYDGLTGKQIDSFQTSYNLPKHKRVSDYGILGEQTSKVSFLTLADTNNNGYWDILLQINDYVINVSIPYRVNKELSKYAPLPFRNIDNSGIIY